MMRIAFKIPVVVLILVTCASSCYAEDYPGIRIDSSFRVEYLFGRLNNRLSDPTNPVYQVIPDFLPLRLDLLSRMAVLTGFVEISPYPVISGRLVGSVSVAEGTFPVRRLIDVTAIINQTGNWARWEVKPDLDTWEVAGLYHLWNAAGYRFSFTAGYRSERWLFHGEPTVAGIGTLRDEYSSSIPFIGLQTSMLFPWWKARFEVLGSPFMNRKATIDNGAFRAQGNGTNGGLLEFQMEGSVGLTPSLFLGINACYSYQELYGNSTASFRDLGGNTTFTLYTTADLLRIGFDINVLF